MKKNAVLLYGLFSAFMLIFLTGCSDKIENISDMNGNEVSTRSLSFTDYYWYNGQKIGINKLNNKKYILFDENNENTLKSYSATTLKFVKEPQLLQLSNKIMKKKLQSSPKNLKWATIETTASSPTLTKLNGIIYEAPYFQSINGTEVGLSHLYYVKLKSDKDVSKLMELASINKVDIIGNNEYMPLWYTLSCSKESTGNALELANKFYETNLFEASEPDLMSDDTPNCVNDSNFSNYQWNLRNTGQNGGTIGVDVNFCNARSITTGSQNVIVAIVDQGIQLDHPDLNVHSISYDTESGTSPSRVLGTHGTNCAGFISAKTNNSIGIASLAPDCPSMSISNSLASSPDSRQKRADGINFAWRNGASVISNSWSSSVAYSIINDAISNALTSGRSGKGCVVVFATGNDYSSTVGYPANCNPDILAVGSNNRNGSRSSFSNYGTALDIVAPGENVCTTTTGSNYSTSISGTSFSCPTAAAVAALVISVNPNLTQKQVVDILEKSARKVGNYAYSTTSNRLNGTWNNEMGYGLLDAYAAVSLAGGENVYFNDQTVSYTQTVSVMNIFSQNVTVTNNATLTFNFIQTVIINPPFTVNAGSQFFLYY